MAVRVFPEMLGAESAGFARVTEVVGDLRFTPGPKQEGLREARAVDSMATSFFTVIAI